MLIRLEDICLTAYHGVLAQEREQGNTFMVTVSLEVPESRGVLTDDIAHTINYQQVYDIVCQQMAKPSNLLEHVAGHIRHALQQAWPKAQVHVQVKKKNPPVGGQVAWATIEL
ncbi:MAG: dihydroneopterin aldolase [Paludibacteraceae bacterium]|nr:dihydroneopterin aldolase [Paludibacteraceae bacterium]